MSSVSTPAVTKPWYRDLLKPCPGNQPLTKLSACRLGKFMRPDAASCSAILFKAARTRLSLGL